LQVILCCKAIFITINHYVFNLVEYSSVDTVPARETPQPFSYPHVVVRFGFGGQLVTVLPFTLNSTYSAKVDIYSVQVCTVHVFVTFFISHHDDMLKHMVF
jgi:hypothetical protein